MKILAYPLENGLYRLADQEKGAVYKIKEAIKSSGGRWSGSYWEVSSSVLTLLNIPRLYYCEVEGFCHTPPEKIYVTEMEAKAGHTYRRCSLCDSSEAERVKILNKIR